MICLAYFIDWEEQTKNILISLLSFSPALHHSSPHSQVNWDLLIEWGETQNIMEFANILSFFLEEIVNKKFSFIVRSLLLDTNWYLLLLDKPLNIWTILQPFCFHLQKGNRMFWKKCILVYCLYYIFIYFTWSMYFYTESISFYPFTNIRHISQSKSLIPKFPLKRR